MTTDNDIEIVVYVFRYPTEVACRAQFADFGKWLEGAGITDWIFCGMSMDQDVWFITVVDATGGRTFNEFTWTGDVFDIDEDYAMGVILHAQPGLASRMSYSDAIAPILRPDGTWVIPHESA